MIYLLVALALIYNFVNGFQGSGSAVATIVSSRAMAPRMALGLIAFTVFAGPFLLGIAVAKTIGTAILLPSAVDPLTVVAALISAILWSSLTWFLGIPSSPSHALVGGMVGAAAAGIGLSAVQSSGVLKVFLALFLSPILGFLFGQLITLLVFFLARNASLKINWWFKNGQILTGFVLGLSNGANDGPKGMGILTLGLLAAGALPDFNVPLWVMLISASAMSLGTVLGGWRLIKTLGGKFYRIRPVDSFCSQVASISVILSAALLGGPVSTTQVISTAIVGVGAAERPNKVRWGVAGNIGMTWLLTIPANIALGWVIYWVGSHLS